MELYHSAKGTTWKNHKYIAIKNGRYIYPSTSAAAKAKRQGGQARAKRDKLVKNSANMVKGSVNVNLRDDKRFGGSSKNSVISITNPGLKTSNEYMESNRLNEGKTELVKIVDNIERKIATKEAAQKTMESGTKAIQRIIGSNFLQSYKTTIRLDGGGNITIFTLGEKYGSQK